MSGKTSPAYNVLALHRPHTLHRPRTIYRPHTMLSHCIARIQFIARIQCIARIQLSRVASPAYNALALRRPLKYTRIASPAYNLSPAYNALALHRPHTMLTHCVARVQCYRTESSSRKHWQLKDCQLAAGGDDNDAVANDSSRC
jgi:hypothetical protein